MAAEQDGERNLNPPTFEWSGDARNPQFKIEGETRDVMIKANMDRDTAIQGLTQILKNLDAKITGDSWLARNSDYFKNRGLSKAMEGKIQEINSLLAANHPEKVAEMLRPLADAERQAASEARGKLVARQEEEKNLDRERGTLRGSSIQKADAASRL